MMCSGASSKPVERTKRRVWTNLYFISHDLSVVKYMSDRMVVMQGGKIEEMGDADSNLHRRPKQLILKLISAIPEGKLEDIKRHLESKG